MDAEPTTATPTADAITRAARAVHLAIDGTAAERVWVWTDLAFGDLALELFRAQYAQVEAYRAWCDHELAERGMGADAVTRWAQVPALPIAAFKQLRVAAYGPGRDVATWHSSGTTGQSTSRHHLPDTSLYEASLLAGAAAALATDLGAGGEPLLGVQLAPTAQELPNSSLSHMFDFVRRRLCHDGGAWSSADGLRVDVEGAWARLEHAAAEAQPVLLLATSFALVQLLDGTADRPAIELAPGSRMMDTGGYKGRTRELTRDELVAAAGERLGLAPELCENEYGMSELSSQAYLGTIATHLGRGLPGCSATPATRWQPPWMRTRVVDPTTLEQVADGETGLLVHHDLANAYSCAVVRSEDLGIRRGASYELVGRAPGAELRGCSLRLEDAGL